MPDLWALAALIVKAAMYVGILSSAGLILTRFLFAPFIAPVVPVMRTHAAIYAALGLGAAVGSFALRGAALTGDASGLIDPDMLGLMWQTPVGTALVLRLAGLSLMLIGLLVGGAGWGLAGAGALAALWSFATIGHLSDGAAFWAQLVVMAHLIAVAFWIGILLPLKRLASAPATLKAAGQLGHRFGQIASRVVPGLILAGLVLGWVLLGSWTNLVTTAYGLSLILKLCGVAVLLALGAWNKLRSVPSLISGNSGAAAHLSKICTVEWYCFIAVLVATSALTTLFAVPDMH